MSWGREGPITILPTSYCCYMSLVTICMCWIQRRRRCYCSRLALGFCAFTMALWFATALGNTNARSMLAAAMVTRAPNNHSTDPFLLLQVSYYHMHAWDTADAALLLIKTRALRVGHFVANDSAPDLQPHLSPPIPTQLFRPDTCYWEQKKGLTCQGRNVCKPVTMNPYHHIF